MQVMQVMQEHYDLLTDLIAKAIFISQQTVERVDAMQFDKVEELTRKREKIINIILTIHERLDLSQKILKNTAESERAIAFNNQLNLLIEKISDFDEYVMVKLNEEKDKTQIEIAKVFKNKENFKGYNLNCLK
jgi:hypothetical protein